MDPFRRLAEQTVARDASVVAFLGVMLMSAFVFEPEIAFKSAGTVALFFSVGLVARALRLRDDRMDRIEAWRQLDPEQRPDDESGRRWARDSFEEVLLRTAKTAAQIAIGFYCAALIVVAA
jgi:hypothetical protein